MKLSLMREFVTLANVQNFSRAAEELYIAQPALSRHIAALENELKTKLIDRSRNSFALTVQGEEALHSFQKILLEYEVLIERIARQVDAEGGELHVGYLYYDKDYYVARIRETFHRKYPKVRLVLHPYQPAELEKNLLSGKLDAAIIYGAGYCENADLQSQAFLKIPYSLFVSEHHPLAGLSEIDVSALNGEKLLCPEETLQITKSNIEMERMLEEYGVEIRSMIPVNNFDEVPWILEETGGVYIAPMVNLTVYGNKIVSRYIMPENYSCDVSVVWENENKNPGIQLLLSIIRICYA
ncbi:MAG: LysR family transcriptional regulator [Lachnospiraceae bacterium]|nr:LysR family transcriptional regulator [Lachnospiraceae bacterium]